MIRLKKPIKNLKNKALVLDRNVPIANFAKKMDDHRRRFVSQNIKCAKAGEELKRAENGMEELHAMMLGLLAASLKCNVASSAHYWPCCARNDLTSLPCHSLSLKNDESGIVMIAALCAMNGDTAFRGKKYFIRNR